MKMHNNDKERIVLGIAAYQYEQDVLLRLLRKRGRFTEAEFDKWLAFREARRPMKCIIRKIRGHTFLLKCNSKWEIMLQILQYLVILGAVSTKKENGKIVYFKESLQ